MKYFSSLLAAILFTMLLQTGITYSQSSNLNLTNIKHVTIAEARKDDNHDLIPDYLVSGDTLMLTGVITVNFTGQLNKTVLFIQDTTAGIQVLYGGVNPNLNLTKGDSVFVIGTIFQFHGNDEINPLSLDSTNFGILKHNSVVPAPIHLTLHQYLSNPENYEGSLIEIDTLYKVSGVWPTADSTGLIYLTNLSKTDKTAMYIRPATNIGGTTEPVYPINIVGVAGQYSSGPTVVTGGYYIDPRNMKDIKNSYQVTIAEARKDDNHDLIPDYLVSGDTLMLTGVITVNFSGQLNKTVLFIQDTTAGIQVLYGGVNPNLNLLKGDSVFVIGTIFQFHGNDEINPLSLDSTSFGILKHNTALPAPIHLTLHQYLSNPENYEGSLIEIDTLYKVSGSWPAADSTGLIYLTNLSKTDKTEMFIYAATEIGGTTEPSYPINVVGIAGQYSSGPTVVTGGYYIDPRDRADISNASITGLNKIRTRVNTYYLYQNYPNPFNPSTNLRYSLPFNSHVRLTVYNILGQRIKVLVDQVQDAGYYKYQWNASEIASGVYICVLDAASTNGQKNYQSIKKMVLLK